jgi:release factor H-coupled RctB family protein
MNDRSHDSHDTSPDKSPDNRPDNGERRDEDATRRDAAEVRVIAGERSWIEGEAVAQLERTAGMRGMRAAIGMPDLHPGKDSPIGAAYITDGRLYPHLVGNDIGCGMGLWVSERRPKQLKRERWGERLRALSEAWEGDAAARLEAAGLGSGPADRALGSVGGGNHFAELQAVEAIEDAAACAALGVDEDRLCVLVHSGSRGLGERILRDHVGTFGAAGVEAEEVEGQRYRERHDAAVRWAKVNREVIAGRFAEAIGGGLRPALDVCHNSVTAIEHGGCACWLHRKGAAPATEGPVVIPGSRGTLSYLVEPTGDAAHGGYSLAHGAGRRWQRGAARDRLRSRYRARDLERTALGGLVICDDRDLLYEEAPEAYKDIDEVVGDLVDAGLCRVLARLRPLITFKVARLEQHPRGGGRPRDRGDDRRGRRGRGRR